MDTDLVRSTLVSLDFPSNFDKEMLDSVGNWGMLNSLFAMLGRAMALSARLMDSTIDNNEIRSLENEVEGLRQEKQHLSDTLDMKLVEIKNLESDFGWQKTMLERAQENLKDIDTEYRAELQRFEKLQWKVVEDKLKEVEAELQETKKRAQSVEQRFDAPKKEAEAMKEEAKTFKEEAKAAKQEVRAGKVLVDAAQLRAKNAEDQLCLIKEAKEKSEAELISKLGEFSNVCQEAFKDGFQRAFVNSHFITLLIAPFLTWIKI